jgi:hypothetical protein
MSPNRFNLFPEHLFGSQCSKSQHAALKGGLVPELDSSSSRGIARWRGAPVENFLPLEEKLSFLWRTIFVDVARVLDTVDDAGETFTKHCNPAGLKFQRRRPMTIVGGILAGHLGRGPSVARRSSTAYEASHFREFCKSTSFDICLRTAFWSFPQPQSGSISAVSFPPSTWRQHQQGWRLETASEVGQTRRNQPCSDISVRIVDQTCCPRVPWLIII